MKTYNDVDDFISEVFPLEYQKIMKQKKSDIENFAENADAEFLQKLDGILKGESEEK